jgi:hypothetical protein
MGGRGIRRWVRKSGEKMERREHTHKCVHGCPSAWMSFCEGIKVKLHFHYVTHYKIKEHYPFVMLYRNLFK